METTAAEPTAKDIIDFVIKSAKVERLKVHNCSLCGYPCGYLINSLGEVFYDSGCYCVSYGPNIQQRDAHNLQEFLSINSRESEYGKKKGFGVADKFMKELKGEENGS